METKDLNTIKTLVEKIEKSEYEMPSLTTIKQIIDKLLINSNDGVEVCDSCGNQNVVWDAPDGLWEKIMNHNECRKCASICPNCFSIKAKGLEINIAFNAIEINK